MFPVKSKKWHHQDVTLTVAVSRTLEEVERCWQRMTGIFDAFDDPSAAWWPTSRNGDDLRHGHFARSGAWRSCWIGATRSIISRFVTPAQDGWNLHASCSPHLQDLPLTKWLWTSCRRTVAGFMQPVQLAVAWLWPRQVGPRLFEWNQNCLSKAWQHDSELCLTKETSRH